LEIDTRQGPPLAEVVKVQAERAKTLKEMAHNSRYFFTQEVVYDDKAVQKNLTPDLLIPLTELCSRLETLEQWQPDKIHGVVHAIAEQYQLKLGKIAQPLRVAVTGATVSPPIDVTVHLIGQAQSVARIRRALQRLA
jgi:glutamyl-tRNA synthetase